MRTRQIERVHVGPDHPDELEMAFSADSRAFAMTDARGWIQLWDIQNTQQLTRLWAPGITRGSKKLASSSDGRMLAAADSKTVWIWDVRTLGLVATFEHVSENIFSMSVSPDGAIIALSGWRNDEKGYRISLWNIKSQQRLVTRPVRTGWIPLLAILPDGRLLASAGTDGVVRLWSIR